MRNINNPIWGFSDESEAFAWSISPTSLSVDLSGFGTPSPVVAKSAAANGNTLSFVGSSTAMVVDLEAGRSVEAARILLLGDSITQGFQLPGGYRLPLYRSLTETEGLWADFVGDFQTNNPVELMDLDHQGVSGITATTVLSNISTIAANNPADFVFMMLGTNDVLNENETAAQTAGELLDIIRALHAANSNVTIFLADIPFINTPSVEQKANDVNALLPGIIATAQSEGINVVSVDTASITNADLADGLHPSASGAAELAQLWLNAILANASTMNGTFDGTSATISGYDNIIGSDGADRLSGDSGVNDINGGADNDWIDGRGGIDILTGGSGRDTFVFSSVAGAGDTITDFVTNTDRILVDAAAFGAIDAGAPIRLVLGTAATQAGATFLYDNSTGELYLDADGTGAAAAQLIAVVSGGPGILASDLGFINVSMSGNQAPTVQNAITDQAADEDTAFTFVVPANTFADPDMDALTLTATLANGNPLPTWLSFDPNTGTFSGTPLNGDVGSITVRVTATDTGSASVFDDFVLVVSNTNDAPVLDNAITDQSATASAAFAFTLPASTFDDVDGDALTLTATLANGDPLPTWLNFDPNTGAFTGTPGAGDVGTVSVRVTATDPSLEAIDDTFDIIVGAAPAGLDYTGTDQALIIDLGSATVTAAARILTIGDSLTSGFYTQHGYRLELWNSIVEERGLWIDFVGQQNDGGNGPLVDDEHFGIGGYRVDDFAPFMGGLISTYSPDFIFVQLGTNDALVEYLGNPNAQLDSDPSVTVPQELLQLLRNAHAAQPGIPILLSELLPLDPSIYTNFSTLNADGDVIVDIINAALPGIVQQARSEGINVTLVNQASFLSSFLAPQDGIHPLEFGDQVAASNWQAALDGLMAEMGGTYSGTPIAITPTDDATGSDAGDRMFGNANANSLDGGAGADWLEGRAGVDTLTGGAGRDTFAILDPSHAGDVITDFVSGQDRIVISAQTFPGLASFSTLEFVVDTPASGTGPAVIYNSTTGELFFDEDGSGASAQILLAVLSGAPTITASDIDIIGQNAAPVLDNPIPDQAFDEYSIFNFTFSGLAFSDPDVQALTYTATLDNGDPLPTWLTFDGASRTFTGNAGDGTDGTYAIRVTATDPFGLQVSDVFNIVVNNLPDPTQSATLTLRADDTFTVWLNGQELGTGFYWTDVVTIVTDLTAGDVIAVQATNQAGPGAFFADIRLADGTSLSSSDGWVVSTGVTGTEWRDQNFDDSAWVNATEYGPLATFPWNAPDPNEPVIPADSDGQWIWDATNQSAETLFLRFVVPYVEANLTPVLDNPIQDQSGIEESAFSFTVPANTFSDPNAGETLSLTAALSNGDPLPSWLVFDPVSGTFSGTPDDPNVGTIDVRVTATDPRGASVSDVFALTVSGVNDAPTVDVGIADQSTNEDAPFSFVIPSDAFEDVDGDTLSLTATLANGDPLPAWLSFDPNTGTFSGTPDNGDVGVITVRVTATDPSLASVFDDFQITVVDTNDAPVLNTALPDALIGTDQAFLFTPAAGTFTDADEEVLSYSATLANGDPLPSWLSIDSMTGELSGSPGAGDVGTLIVRLRATDPSGAFAEDTFSIEVESAGAGGVINYSSTSTGRVINLADQTSADTARILLLGDSLTNGFGLPGGYRLPLEGLFQTNGVLADFVGSLTDNPGTDQLDPNHQGQNGATTLSVLSSLGLITSANPHDIAFVLLGTNDVINSADTPATIAARLLDIVRGLAAANPDVTVLLGSLPGVANAADQTEIDALNALLPGLVAQATSEGIALSLVDLTSVTGSDTSDGLHPTAAGAATIAQLFYNALAAAVPPAAGTFGEPFINLNAVRDVWGSEANDRIIGNGDGNIISGRGGNDIIFGGDGTDFLAGNAGRDLIYGEDGSDFLSGGTGGDLLDGGNGTDTADYSASNTGVTVDLGGGIANGGHAEGDTLVSIENLLGSAFADNLIGDDDTNVLQGQGGNDVIHGGGGNDFLFGEANNDALFGENGDDFLFGGIGADSLYGGTGADTAVYFASLSGIVVNLTTNVNTGGEAQGDSLTDIENVIGTNFNDVITGDGAANVLQGYDGADELNGEGGNDLLFGNDGADTLRGGLGSDFLVGGAGADMIDGGDGLDSASYGDSAVGVIVNLTTGIHQNGSAAGDTLTNIENVYGSLFADQITGDAQSNLLWGDQGDDILTGGGGDDILIGGQGGDTLNGGEGSDTAAYFSSLTGVSVNLATNVHTGGNAAGDTLTGIENVIGSNFDDMISGDNTNNVLQGFAGNDSLIGSGGNDALYGQDGADTLRGGEGNDSLFGGAGVDSFVFTAGEAGSDFVYDFEAGEAIELLGFGYATAAAASVDFTQDGSNVVFVNGGVSITFLNAALADILAGVSVTSSAPPQASGLGIVEKADVMSTLAELDAFSFSELTDATVPNLAPAGDDSHVWGDFGFPGLRADITLPEVEPIGVTDFVATPDVFWSESVLGQNEDWMPHDLLDPFVY